MIPLSSGSGRLPLTDEMVRSIRERVLAEVVRAFVAASMSGLCSEGALEAAIGQARELPIETLLGPAPGTTSDNPG
jgi:hypothetical protein